MLGAQLKDDADADDDVLKVGIIEGFALPLVALILAFPELAGQLRRTILPTAADPHALIQLDAHF